MLLLLYSLVHICSALARSVTLVVCGLPFLAIHIFKPPGPLKRRFRGPAPPQCRPGGASLSNHFQQDWGRSPGGAPQGLEHHPALQQFPLGHPTLRRLSGVALRLPNSVHFNSDLCSGVLLLLPLLLH